MANVTAIRVENLSKRYTIRHAGDGRRGGGLRHAIQHAVATPLRMIRRSFRSTHPSQKHLEHLTPSTENFYALRDITFEVKRGEVLGIIGRNGAGKSTLLKILSRITDPTAGRIGINGRVSSLLEVGTGFHPELTGRENIFLNGAILGMTRTEVRARFDEIMAFAGVERFLDTPVKRYSSGMYVRLAFAVAAHLETETLIVDEVLAVGDAEFQNKCLGKMRQVASASDRTVIFVSHNLEAMRSLCTRTIHLNAGMLVSDGAPEEVIANYFSDSRTPVCRAASDDSGPIGFVDCSISGSPRKLCGEPIQIKIAIKCLRPSDSLTLSITITSLDTGASCYLFYNDPSGRLGHHQLGPLTTGIHTRICEIKSFPGYKGDYRLKATLYCSSTQKIVDELDGVAPFRIEIPHDLAPGGDWKTGLCSFLVSSQWQIGSRS